MARGDRLAERREREDVKRRVSRLSDELSELPRIDYGDPGQVRERCKLHRAMCEDRSLMPTIGTLAIALDVSISQVTHLANAQQSGWHGCRLTQESAEVLEKELVMIESIFDSNFENGAYANPVTGIFAAKNLFGWKDSKETQQVVAHIELTPEQIAGRYTDALPMHVDYHGEVHQLQDAQRARSAGRLGAKIGKRIDAGDFPKFSGELESPLMGENSGD